MRITALLQKIHELASKPDEASAIDIDLMLDYTRVLYSDLLEWRNNPASPKMPEPTMTAASEAKAEPVVVEEIKSQPVVEMRQESAQMNGHAQETPKIVMPLSSPGSPVVQQTSVQFAAPELEEEEEELQEEEAEEAAPVPPAPKELTLEEYLARQRKLDGEADDMERDDDASIAAPGRAQQPSTSASPALPPVPIAKVEAPAPAVTPMPTPPPQPRDIRTMIGINDKYQIMSELFGNDKAAYEQALDVINRADSEQAAFNWLRERLWVTEDHSDAAMIFFDVVRRFKNG